MPHENIHLSDQDLIMAADGELPVRRKVQALAHLDACWLCRERMNSLEATISEFVRASNYEYSDRVPPAPGSRALLRARLAEAAAAKAAWPRAIWRLVPVAVAFVSVVAVIAMIFGTTANAEGPRPKSGLTPGETRPITLAEICHNSQAEVVTGNIPEETRRKVFSEYGISARAD